MVEPSPPLAAQQPPLPSPILPPPTGPPVTELIAWLEEEEIEPYLEGAHPEILNTDLRFYKAAGQLRDYAAILSRTSDEQIGPLIEMLLYIVDPPIPIDSSIEWFHKRLQAMRPPDEPLYAIMGGEWIDALIGYTRTLNTEFHWPIDKCVEKAMRDYIIRLKTDDHRFFVKQYLLWALGDDAGNKTTLANLIWSNRPQ